MEIRLAKGTVANSWMVFSVVVAQVQASGLPVDEELFLLGPILDPVKAHVNCPLAFLLYSVDGKTLGCGVIHTYGGGRLRMAKFC